MRARLGAWVMAWGVLLGCAAAHPDGDRGRGSSGSGSGAAPGDPGSGGPSGPGGFGNSTTTVGPAPTLIDAGNTGTAGGAPCEVGKFCAPTGPDPDNCGSLSDCYNTLGAAVSAAAGLGLFGMLLSMGLDLLPGIGTVKGVIEGITGRDLVTGEELPWWARVLGVVPGLGAVDNITAMRARLPPMPTM